MLVYINILVDMQTHMHMHTHTYMRRQRKTYQTHAGILKLVGHNNRISELMHLVRHHLYLNGAWVQILLNKKSLQVRSMWRENEKREAVNNILNAV